MDAGKGRMENRRRGRLLSEVKDLAAERKERMERKETRFSQHAFHNDGERKAHESYGRMQF